MKEKTVFFCSECGCESPKWMGKCPGCGQWNTMIEEKVAPENSKNRSHNSKAAGKPKKLSEISSAGGAFEANISELDRVLGGGAVAPCFVRRPRNREIDIAFANVQNS